MNLSPDVSTESVVYYTTRNPVNVTSQVEETLSIDWWFVVETEKTMFIHPTENGITAKIWISVSWKRYIISMSWDNTTLKNWQIQDRRNPFLLRPGLISGISDSAIPVSLDKISWIDLRWLEFHLYEETGDNEIPTNWIFWEQLRQRIPMGNPLSTNWVLVH